MLATPPIAAMQFKNEVTNMARIANENFNLACELVCTLDYDKIELFRNNEKTLDFLNREINRFIAKLLEADLGEKDRMYLFTAIRSASDLERVGDYAENLTEYADKLKEIDGAFSPEAVTEITDLKETVNRLFDSVLEIYKDNSAERLSEALQIEESIDAVTEQMAQRHIGRLERGECTPEIGAQYLSLAANVERIADHYINVAKTVKIYA